ncbi:MAG: tetratricopeptide repeat protein [Bdellovibrio sp.]|nr:tetratricopeptide repeat protein [Bdellovibrio sp.]
MSGGSASNQRYWLIKSATRILGPYTLAELTEQLKTKQISVIDEVRQPDGRWSYIRENQMFMDIVQSLRDEADPHSELTMTHSVAQHTAITRTDVNVSDDLTPTPISNQRRHDDMKDVTSSAESTVSRGGLHKAKSYAASSDARVQDRLQKKTEYLRWMLFLVGVIAVAAIVLILTQKEKKKTLGYDEFMAQALRYKALGLYEKSLQSYQKASKLREPDSEAQMQMAPVLISEDRQSLAGRRILEQALGKDGRPRAEVVNAYLGIAVSYMMDGDMKPAEDTLQKVLGYDPSNIPAQMNLAIIRLKRGDNREAAQTFDGIYRKNPQSGLALFGRALAVVEQAKAQPEPTMLQNLVRDIQSYVQRSGYLRQELLLFNIYAQSLLGDIDGVNQSVVGFLVELPGQAVHYTHPLFVDWRFTQWDSLEKYCSEILQKVNIHPELKAFRAVCLMEVNRFTDSSKILEEALAEAPKDPYILMAQANFLKKIGRIPEMHAILKLPELQNLTAKNLLLGETCMQNKDIACAHGVYKSVLERDKNNITAIYGLSWAMTQNTQERRAAYEQVRLGLQNEPNYLPLLELRDQMENEP